MDPVVGPDGFGTRLAGVQMESYWIRVDCDECGLVMNGL